MSSPTLIGVAIAVFFVAALLYFQSIEGFVSNVPIGSTALGSTEPIGTNVPADLNLAPVSRPLERIPQTQSGPSLTSTPIQRDALATLAELAELDSKLMTWLAAASQRELENPAALTATQREQRVQFQARVSAIRQQLGTGLIVDKSKDVSAEIMKMRNLNASWQVYPSIVDANEFAVGKSDTSFLTDEEYAQFRGIMNAYRMELEGYPQPEPLLLVRMKQLELIDTELRPIDAQNRVPLIRVGSARSFLQMMRQPTQPLPSLISMDGIYDSATSLAANPIDIIRQVQTIPNPPLALIQMVNYLASGTATTKEVVDARNLVNSEGYNPSNFVARAAKLCREVKEAFPNDFEALGCTKKRPITEEDGRTVVYTVCQRIRESVPTVTPEQFNCPH